MTEAPLPELNYVALALQPAGEPGEPVVAFLDRARNLRVAQRTAGSWTTTTVAALCAPGFLAIAAHADQQLVVYTQDHGQQRTLCWARRAGPSASWIGARLPVHIVGGVGMGAGALHLSHSGAHLVYLRQFAGLDYVYAREAQDWQLEPVPVLPPDHVAAGYAVAWDQHDQPHLAVLSAPLQGDSPRARLSYAWRTPAGQWTSEDVPVPACAPGDGTLALQLDAGDRPHVAYATGALERRQAWYVVRGASAPHAATWESELAIAAAAPQSMMLRLDRQGQPVLLGVRPTCFPYLGGPVVLATRRSQRDWPVTVAALGPATEQVRMANVVPIAGALDAQGQIHLAYWEGFSEITSYAHSGDGGQFWRRETVWEARPARLCLPQHGGA